MQEVKKILIRDLPTLPLKTCSSLPLSGKPFYEVNLGLIRFFSRLPTSTRITVDSALYRKYLLEKVMTKEAIEERPTEPTVTVEDVNRVLEVGRLLLSVLTQEEMEEIQALLYGEPYPLPEDSVKLEIGNMGVT